jgi:hypothetical protein
MDDELDNTYNPEPVCRHENLVKYLMYTVWSGDWAFFGGDKTGPNQKSLVGPTSGAAAQMHHQVMGHYGVSYEPIETRILAWGGYSLQCHQSVAEFTNTAFDVDARRTIREYQYGWKVRYAIKSFLVVDTTKYDILKSLGMVLRRFKAGRPWAKQPYFGRAECLVDHFGLVTPQDDLTPVNLDLDMGIQPFGQDFSNPRRPWYYYPMNVRGGIIQYPTWDEVRAYGFTRAA